MGYKRTTKKIGNGVYKSKTINSKGGVTTSISTGSKYSRHTYSSGPKGSRLLYTWRDGGGYIHRKTEWRTKTAADYKRQERDAREFWNWALGSKKTRTKKKPAQKWNWLMILSGIAVLYYISLAFQ